MKQTAYLRGAKAGVDVHGERAQTRAGENRSEITGTVWQP